MCVYIFIYDTYKRTQTCIYHVQGWNSGICVFHRWYESAITYSGMCVFTWIHHVCGEIHTHRHTRTQAKERTQTHAHATWRLVSLVYVWSRWIHCVCGYICMYTHTRARTHTHTHTHTHSHTTWRLRCPVCVWNEWMYPYTHMHMLVYLQCICCMVWTSVWTSHIYTVTWFESCLSNATYTHCAYTIWHT